MSLFGYVPKSEVDNLLHTNNEMESQIAGLKSTLATLRKQHKEKVDGLTQKLIQLDTSAKQNLATMEKLRLEDHAKYKEHYDELDKMRETAEKAEDEHAAKATSLEGKLKEVQADNDNLRATLSKIKTRGDKYKGQVEQMNSMITNGTEENKALKLQIENLQKMVASKDSIIQSFTTLTQAHIFVGPVTKKRKADDLALCD